MEAPDFWDDTEVSQVKMKELKSLKDDVETYAHLTEQYEDIETLLEMGYEENDPSIIPEIQEMLDEFQRDFDNIRVKTLLSGEYDSENAIIKLSKILDKLPQLTTIEGHYKESQQHALQNSIAQADRKIGIKGAGEVIRHVSANVGIIQGLSLIHI